MGARPWRRREPGLGEAPPCVGSRTLTSMHRRALVVGNGAAGAEKQALALARALGDPSPGVYRTPFRSWAERVPAAWACPVLHRGGPKAARVPGFAETVGDLPRGAYVVGCGRSVAGLVAAVSRLGLHSVQIQLPRGAERWFDAVVTPRHDFRDTAPPANVVLTRGSVTEPSHAAASPIFAPSAAVLLGGHARHAHFDVQRATDAVRGACLASEIVFVSTSRRSPRELASLCAAALREEVAAGRCTGGAVYDASRDATATVGSLPPLAAPPTSANPLPHFMAVAGALVVSDDSMSMVTEACATAKPVCAVACSRPAYAEAARSAARRLCGRDPANKLAWSLEQLEAEQAVAWVHGGRDEGLAGQVAAALEEAWAGHRRPSGPLDDLAAVASTVRALCEG